MATALQRLRNLFPASSKMVARTITARVGEPRHADVSEVLHKLQAFLRQTGTPRYLDTRRWIEAVDSANNTRYPNRGPLLAIYRRVVRDAHLRAVMNARVLKVLGQQYKLTRNGEEQVGLLEGFRTQAMEEVLRLALESKFYGHSLIDLGFDAIGELARVAVVPREHVEPHYGLLVYTPGMNEGINYREHLARLPGFTPPRGVFVMHPREVLIEVGSANNLGLLESASYNVIQKENALMDWAEFSERFGMPQRVAKVGQASAELIAQVEEMLHEVGAGGAAILPEGVEMSLSESTRPDAYRVYTERIRLADEYNSKLFGGQTMTMDNGSSRAQAEVHERMFNEVVDADKRFLQDFVNEQVLPTLAAYNGAYRGVRFAWTKYENMGQLARIELYTKLASLGYQVSRVQVEQEFGVQLADPAA